MDQIDPHYLQTIINVLTGADKQVKRFAYGPLEISFHQDQPPVIEYKVEGFKTQSPTNEAASMHERLRMSTAPELNAKVPDGSSR